METSLVEYDAPSSGEAHAPAAGRLLYRRGEYVDSRHVLVEAADDSPLSDGSSMLPVRHQSAFANSPFGNFAPRRESE